MNLEHFGRTLRELRQGRGLTQDEVIKRTNIYSDSRNLRNLEAGEQRPRRKAIILLLTKGLEEKDPSKINTLLQDAGYEGLRLHEIQQLGLTPPVSVPESQSIQPVLGPAAISERSKRQWGIAAILAIIAGIVVSVALKNLFITVAAILYAALYGTSVLLECAYRGSRDDANRAALLAFAFVWLTSLAAMWADSAVPGELGVWASVAILSAAAILQWILLKPVLVPDVVVDAKFQAQTARAAHLKNTAYFLLLAFSFWILPVHCVGSAGRGPDRAGRMLCPPPGWLWILLVIYIAGSLPMGHYLLTNLKPSGGFDRYLILFYSRAILWFLLSVVCLIWYTLHYA